MIFNRDGRVVVVDQKEHEQIFPRAGWVEHNATEIWDNTREVVGGRARPRPTSTATDIAAVGITNQRETALVWDRTTGEPVYNAIVWQDTRTDGICHAARRLGGGAERYKAKVGLPLATYFSGPEGHAGSSTTSTAPGRRPRPATWCSATWTPGCCGT